MASPQLENGYAPIANELLEALYRAKFTGGELRTILCVLRASYGWSRPGAPLSIREVARRVNKDHGYIQKIVGDLLRRDILARNGEGLSLVKNYDLWKDVGEEVQTSALEATAPGDTGVTTPVTQGSPLVVTRGSPDPPFKPTSIKGFRPRKTILKQTTKTKEEHTLGQRLALTDGKGGQGRSIPTLPDGFDEFWEAYPRKVHKLAAQAAWKKLFQKYAPSEALRGRILEALEVHKRSWGWRKEGGQYIPHPASWLNGERWEDQIEEPGVILEGGSRVTSFRVPPEPGKYDHFGVVHSAYEPYEPSGDVKDVDQIQKDLEANLLRKQQGSGVTSSAEEH